MRTVLLGLTLVCLSFPLTADGFADWLKRDRESFRTFRTREDRAFREFLRQEWEEFEAFKAREAYSEPKFPAQPIVDASDYPSERNTFSTPGAPGSAYGRVGGDSGSRFIDYSNRSLPSTVLELFDISFRFPVTERELPRLQAAQSRSLGEYWEEISGLDMEAVFTALDRARTDLKLGDWGFARLLYNYAQAAGGQERIESYPLTWYLLLRAGYDIRIGFDGTRDGIYLLLAYEGTIYESAYTLIGGKRYYFLDLDRTGRYPAQFSSYAEEFPGELRSMSFSLATLPALRSRTAHRNLTFSYGGRDISLRLEYESGLVAYFSDYPQTPFGSYLAGSASTTFSTAVADAFAPLLEDMSEAEAANLLLRFVQTAFAYRTDQDQFAREKWMLPEEILHYPYSDCDDRSILYAWLVRELLGLPVIGIQWPGHMATAVAFSDSVAGAGFLNGGRRWTVCDPTYLGADIGMVMPAFSSQGFTVIPPGDEKL